MTPIQCATCKHYREKNNCDAFPGGIPDRLLTGEVDHDRPEPEQKNDIVWEKR